jgi:hypothetical protein
LRIRAEGQLTFFKKLKTEPNAYYLESKNPCDNCLGVWPCIMKRNAPKCRTCQGLPCSFYDPNAVETEPEFPKSKKTNHKKTKPTRSSSSSVSFSDEDLQFLRYIDSLPVETLRKSRSELAPVRKEVMDDVEDKGSDEEKINHKKNKPTKPSSSKATSSKRQLSELSELSYVDSSPVKPQKERTSRIKLTTAREVVVIDVENEESDEEQVSHKPTNPTEPPSSRVTSSKRQVTELPELPYVDSSPVEPPKTKKSRTESAPVRKEVVDNDEDEESDDGKYYHNSRTTRILVHKLESQKWYKRLEGNGHCQRALLKMEELHWKSLNRQMKDDFGK